MTDYIVGDFVRILCGRFKDEVGQIVCMKACRWGTDAYSYTIAIGYERFTTNEYEFERYVVPTKLGG
jgi:hypothetical protein